MADVFLSYSFPDRQAAARLAAQLRHAGVGVAWDQDIGSGEVIAEALSTAIAQAKVFVVLQPGQTGSSDFIHKETQAAIARSAADGLPVLPVLLPGREPAGDLGKFRDIRVASEHDFAPVIEVVRKMLTTADRSGPSSAGLRLSFLSSLLNTDLIQAPHAAAVVLDEIAQTVGGHAEDVDRQLDVLREATNWGEVHLGPKHPSVASLKYRLAEALLRSGRYDESLVLSEQALRMSSRPEERLEASLNLGNALLASGRPSEAYVGYQQSLELARMTGSEWAMGTSLVALGTVARALGDLSGARRFYEEAVAVTALLAQPTARLRALVGLCEVMADMGDAEGTRAYAKEAVWLSRTTLAGDDALALRAAAALVGAEGDDK